MSDPLDKMAENARELGLDYEPAQQQEQEPFGYFKPEPFGWTDCAETDDGAIALYEHPPASKPWVGLSNDEIYDMYNEPRSDAEMVEFARAIEAKLKEKNT